MAKANLIFLHGWAKKKEDYRELVSRLAGKYKVFDLDLPGFGETPIDRPFDLTDYANYIADFLLKKKLKKIILAGHSFGGRVSIKFALNYPELIDKLILIDSAGIERGKNLQKLISKITPKFARPILRNIFSSNDYLNASPLMRETMKKVIAENLEPELHKIKIPTLIIWGENDHTTPLWMGKVMAAQIQGSTLSVIPNGDHGVPYRMANEVAKIIKQLI